MIAYWRHCCIAAVALFLQRVQLWMSRSMWVWLRLLLAAEVVRILEAFPCEAVPRDGGQQHNGKKRERERDRERDR